MEEKAEEIKVALAHDFLVDWGGAEETLAALAEIYPTAPIYTLIFDREKIGSRGEWLKNRVVRESFLGRMPNFLKRRKKWLLPFLPTAPETFDLRDFDLVISSSGGFVKSLVVKSKTLHFCYLHSPLRYVWDWSREYLEENRLKGRSKILVRLFLNYLRLWDRSSAQRPDYFLANSWYTAQRIEKYYHRKSAVIYPPVKLEDFSPQKRHQGYFLTVARLSAYKRMDLLIEVFHKLNLPLKIVGQGVEEKRLAKKIQESGRKNVQLLGWVERKDLVKLYENCRAFILAAEEDFGIVMVEALAAGKPVIALNQGGAKEIIKEGENGILFDYAELELIADGVRRFIEQEDKFDCNQIRQTAEKFSWQRFQTEIVNFIQEKTTTVKQ